MLCNWCGSIMLEYTHNMFGCKKHEYNIGYSITNSICEWNIFTTHFVVTIYNNDECNIFYVNRFVLNYKKNNILHDPIFNIIDSIKLLSLFN